jgi:hypothetical protein
MPKVKTDIIKDKKINCYCDLCNSPIYSSPCRIQLQNLTGKAYWHRDCNIERAVICDKCASELNTIIDKFIIDKNPSLKKYN